LRLSYPLWLSQHIFLLESEISLLLIYGNVDYLFGGGDDRFRSSIPCFNDGWSFFYELGENHIHKIYSRLENMKINYIDKWKYPYFVTFIIKMIIFLKIFFNSVSQQQENGKGARRWRSYKIGFVIESKYGQRIFVNSTKKCII